jgi:fatty acid desaturase
MFLIITPPVLFTPFFVYVLLKEKRYGWLTTYFLMVILPGIIILITFWDDISKIGVLLFLVLPFYLFCFFIKFSVEEWIREYTWEQQLIQQRK